MRRPSFLLVLLALTTTACSSMRVGSDYDHQANFVSAATYDWVEPPAADDADEAAVDRINPFIGRRLTRAVEDELGARGFQQVEDGPVDLLVAVDVLDADRIDEVQRASAPIPVFFGVGFGYNPGYWAGPWGGYGGYYPYYGFSRRGAFGRYGYGRRYGSIGFGVGFGATPYFGYPSYVGGAYRSYGGYSYRGSDYQLAPGSFVIDFLDGETGELVWRGWADGALYYAPDVRGLPKFIASTVHKIMADFPGERATPSQDGAGG